MKKNTSLPDFKKFENEAHFYIHVSNLLKHLYSNAEIDGRKITFSEEPFIGVIGEITAASLYVYLDETFKEKHPLLKQNEHIKLPLVNTNLALTWSTGNGHMYPLDRNEFPDTKLGMEQKAAFFVIVMEVCLKQLIKM